MSTHHKCGYNCGGTECTAPERPRGIKIKPLPCPCGKLPEKLVLVDAGQGSKWAFVYGDCCGEWHIEFRTMYHPLESIECEELAVEAWNEAPRPV